MKLKFVSVFVISFVMSLFLMSFAYADNNNCSGCSEIVGKLFPGKKIDEVTLVTTNPLYQVVVDGKIIYTDGVNHLMLGAVLDTATGVNITQAKFEQISRVDFSDFALEKAILVKGKGNNKKKALIFHDVDCPFCKKLISELNQLPSDIDVYVYLFPLTNIHPQALDKSVAIWCSNDKAKYLDDVTKGGEPPNVSACITPIPDILKLGEKYNIVGTPTIFLSTNERIGGYVPSNVIVEKFSKAK